MLELGFIDNPLRRIMAKATGQNVVTTIAPAAEHRQDLVLIEHIDTPRTPIVFSTPRWVATYKAFTTVVFVLFAAQTLLYLLGTVTGWPWLWPLTGLSAVGAVLLMAMCIQADLTPFTAGANDNASAVGLVLTLAETLRSEPLHHPRLGWHAPAVRRCNTTAPSTSFGGTATALKQPSVIAFEMLGCAGPSWLTNEGIVVPFHADPGLLRLAEEVAAQHPELGAYPTQISGGNTEMADALRLGIPAITLGGHGESGDSYPATQLVSVNL